jgi:hypothetical protein
VLLADEVEVDALGSAQVSVGRNKFGECRRRVINACITWQSTHIFSKAAFEAGDFFLEASSFHDQPYILVSLSSVATGCVLQLPTYLCSLDRGRPMMASGCIHPFTRSQISHDDGSSTARPFGYEISY